MRTALPLSLLLAACAGSPQPTKPASAPPAAPAPAAPRPAAVTAPAAPSAGEAFLAQCRQPIADAKAQQQMLLDVKDPRAIANTFETFNELSRLLANAFAMSSLMQAVHPDAGVRDAARACEAEAQSFASALLLDRRVYDALGAVDDKQADANTRRFAMVTLREYRRAGVALDEPQRARIKQIDEESTKLGQQIQKNVAEDTRSVEVTSPSRLAGMPDDWIAEHKPDAKGVIRVTTDYPDYIPFMTYADDDGLRKELYVKFKSRGDGANEALLQQLFVLRAEKAKLLGFKDWADYQSDDKMLKGGKNAARFIERIRKLAEPRAKRDYAELLEQLKRQDPRATAVGDWQKSYLENKAKKEKYTVDSAEVRKYFPFDQTLAGLLDITSLMYDVQYQPTKEVPTWHPDVKVFDVTRQGRSLGRIYLDMHPRPDKYKHAAQFTLRDGAEGKQQPEGVLVCNFAAGRSLMEHDDVITMFHEFGHLMHHVLGGHQKWIRQSGTSTEQDFVEAPSQMFEEWGWSYDTLARFAKHHETGEVISRELVRKMRRADKFGLGTQTLQQMFYAAISLTFHQVDPVKLDQLATVKKLQATYTPFAYVEGTRFHTSFTHLVGYSSMYYTYMWSLVIAKDLLTPFAAKGLLDAAVAVRYRDKILAAGSTKDAADLVRDFLGRKYNFKAFEKYLSSAD